MILRSLLIVATPYPDVMYGVVERDFLGLYTYKIYGNDREGDDEFMRE